MTSSLGLLGQYSSDSEEVSDSDGEGGGCGLPHPPSVPHPPSNEGREEGPPQRKRCDSDDPLALAVGSDSTSSSDEESADVCSSSPSPPLSSLPLPNLEAAVAHSVFSNPYQEAEEKKMAALKKHGDFNQLQTPDKRVSRKRPRPLTAKPTPTCGPGDLLFDEQDSSVGRQLPRKHRSGAGRGLVPPKRAMRMHRTAQAKERPWTLQ